MEERVPQYERPSPEVHGLHKLSDLDGWDIIEGPDTRGWSVLDRDDKKIGKVDDLIVDTDTGEVEMAIISYGGMFGMGGDKTAIPIEQLEVMDDEQVKISRTEDELKNAPMYKDDTRDFDQFYDYWGGRGAMPAMERERERGVAEGREVVVPEIEERLVTGKRREQVGEVEVRKEVETRPETVRETLRKTRVRVSRRPATGREVREGERVLREGESITIPVVEEKMVVEKRQEVTGEVVVEPMTVEEEAKATREVRKEHVEVERHGEAELEEERDKAHHR